MNSADRIRALIAAQKIGHAEGAELLAAFTTAEARDRVIGEEIRRLRSRRRGSRWWSALSMGLGAFAIAVLLYSALGPDRVTPPHAPLS